MGVSNEQSPRMKYLSRIIQTTSALSLPYLKKEHFLSDRSGGRLDSSRRLACLTAFQMRNMFAIFTVEIESSRGFEPLKINFLLQIEKKIEISQGRGGKVMKVAANEWLFRSGFGFMFVVFSLGLEHFESKKGRRDRLNVWCGEECFKRDIE